MSNTKKIKAKRQFKRRVRKVMRSLDGNPRYKDGRNIVRMNYGP